MSDKQKYIVEMVIFLFIILGIFFLNIIKKDEDISLAERRKLEKMPDISIDKILSGKFSDDFENYNSDQFVFRDNLRKIKNIFHLNVLKQKDVNGYFIEDEVIYKIEYPLNEYSILNASNKMNQIKDKYLNDTNKIYYSIIPDKSYFLKDNKKTHLLLDYDKLITIMNENLKDFNYINLFETLEIEDYYKTDTHWKQENLLKVAEKLSKEMNFYIDNNYEIKSVGDFLGVYYSQLGILGIKDELKYVVNDSIKNSVVYNVEKDKEESVYNKEELTSLDKYNFFLSGPTPLLKITNNISDNQKKLIVFRDSFGSSLIPLLISGYKEIYVVDTRYISINLLGNYIDFNNSDVLFIYSTLLINQSSGLK